MTSKCEIDENGTKWWRDEKGECHREDGPAIEYASGSKRWYRNGKFHREDGPAIEDADGTKKWYLDGKLHREDGPAIEYAYGAKYFFLHDYPLSENWHRLILRDETFRVGETFLLGYERCRIDSVEDYNEEMVFNISPIDETMLLLTRKIPILVLYTLRDVGAIRERI